MSKPAPLRPYTRIIINPSPLILPEGVICTVSGLLNEKPGTTWNGIFMRLRNIDRYIFIYEKGAVCVNTDFYSRSKSNGKLRIWIYDTGEEYDLSRFGG